MVGRTYGVYIDEFLELVLDAELSRRRLFDKKANAQSLPKLVVGCVQYVIAHHKIKEVDYIIAGENQECST